MRDVAVVSFAQTPNVGSEPRNEVEMLLDVVARAVRQSGIPREQIGFTCSGSCDYIAGQPFSFVMALDAVGAWPPIAESHVEMDAAWALYEAWVKIQTGQCESALVYGFGKSSMGSIADVVTLQLDPYLLAPLWPTAPHVAALQARKLIDAGKTSEREMAEVAARNRKAALSNPNAHVKGEFDVDALLAEPYLASPLRRHDCPPVTDGASAVVIAAAGLAREVSKRPAWIRGLDHRIEPHSLGARDLTISASTRIAADKAGVGAGPVDVAEVYTPFSHQEKLVTEALGLGGDCEVNPSGGTLSSHPFMSAGLTRVGEVAQRILDGNAGRGVAHATSGPCLQQNLVCVLEGE
jgi:acetyl-CoA acetyltransferase